MIKELLLTSLCIFALSTQANEQEHIEIFNMFGIQDNSGALLRSSHQYLDFINRISKGEAFSLMDEAATLLSPDCKKVLNGQLFTKNRLEFVSDLLSVYKNLGSWKVLPVDIITSPASNTVVLRLLIEMSNSDTYTAIVILRYNSDYLITEINEVLSKVKGTYDF